MTYPEQLQTDKWKRKRQKILLRDKNKCQKCYNRTLINESEKGLFSGFCFPQQRDVIDIDEFGPNKFSKARINKQYSNLLNKNAFVYSKDIPNWERTVIGLRKPTVSELNVLKDFNGKTDFLMKKYIQTLNFELFDQMTKLNAEKIGKLAELENKQKLDEFEWEFLLGLHIHHNYYINGLKAWEYKDDALQTLCYDCHENLHKNKTIPVYDKQLKPIGNYRYCIRCHGAGVFPEYNHVQNGICFKCNGLRYEELKK